MGDIWLGGVDPFVRHVMKAPERSDYTDLFTPGTPWSRAAKSVRAFETSTQFLEHGSDDQLRQMIGGLRQQGVVLALTALMTPKHEACGGNVEGYSRPGTIAKIARRIRDFGGEITYVSMDEPLWYGHFYSGPNACHDPIEVVAQQVAENVQALRAVFPNVKIGEDEPVAARKAPPDWSAEILAFAQAYKTATGTPLDFFHADIDWHRDWREAIGDLAPKLRAAGIRFGIIYNGSPDDDTDLAWTLHAVERFEAVESDPALRPEDAILQTWMLHPAHMLPEDQPGTMTNLVLRYMRGQPHLSVSKDGKQLTGRLTGGDGNPITDAPIDLSIIDMVTANRRSDRTITGIVPNGAVSAVAVIRVNTECDCSGSGSLSFGNPRYRDGGGDQNPKGPDMPPGGMPVHIQPGQKFAPNGEPFQVAAGSPFTFSIALDGSRTLEYGGYAALIFLDARHNDIRRLTMRLSPSELPLGEVRTDVSGAFAFPLSSPAAGTVYRAYFPGNDAMRAVAAESR